MIKEECDYCKKEISEETKFQFIIFVFCGSACFSKWSRREMGIDNGKITINQTTIDRKTSTW